MTISYCALSSGSAGNCLWVSGGGVEVLVDCGLSRRETARRLSSVGLDLDNVTAAVCSHGHGDHVKGAAVLARRSGMDIHATAETLPMISGEPPREALREIPRSGVFRIGGLAFTAVPTMHDAPGSAAFVIDDGETRLGVVTDLGIVTNQLTRCFQKLDGLVLEMNHDEDMLRDGPYPYFLKRRIAGSGGHLSNRQGADFLRGLLHADIQHITLAHLSEENNRPERAREVAERVIGSAGLGAAIAVAGIEEACEPVTLEGRGQLPLW